MIRRFCDECNKEIKEDYYTVDLKVVKCYPDGMQKDSLLTKGYEICEKCSDTATFTINESIIQISEELKKIPNT